MEEQSPKNVDAPLATGDVLLDRYRIVKRLGSGGHSVVYRADDERLRRPVCVKIFHHLRGSEEGYRVSYEHFVQEAFALSKLTHPSILRIYDFGHIEGENGPPFQITEYMNGGTVGGLVRKGGPLTVEQALRVTGPLCGALSEAHAVGIIHRDVKPKNILLSTAGASRVVKLADFGIAKSLPIDDEAISHREGDACIVAGRPVLMYSPRWAAPEQMTTYPVSPVSDLYSLALVAIYALTGRVVFPSTDARTAYTDRTASDDRIDEILADTAVPKPARELLKRTCSFDPRLRPRTADELAEALQRALRADDHAALAPVPRGRERAPAEPSTPIERLRVQAEPARVGDRRVRFVAAPDGVADVDAGGEVRLRVTLLPSAAGRFCVHVKALGGFVQLRGGRPSRAVQLHGTGDIEIVAPSRALLGAARIAFARPAAGHSVFSVGDREVAVADGDVTRAVLLDFGPGADGALVHVARSQPRDARASTSES